MPNQSISFMSASQGALRSKEDELAFFRELAHVIEYDPETGAMTWTGHKKASLNGRTAGYKKNGAGYVITYNRIKVSARRFAWFCVHGDIPSGHVTHRDGDIFNMAADNICDFSATVRRCNTHCTSVSGVYGIAWHASRNYWTVYHTLNSRDGRHHIGVFTDLEDAKEAKRAFLLKHGGMDLLQEFRDEGNDL